jgi:hypothetical protein
MPRIIQTAAEMTRMVFCNRNTMIAPENDNTQESA